VVISSRDKARIDDAVAELGGHAAAAGIAADLTDPATPDLLIETARHRFGRLDGALISVGGPAHGSAADVTDDDWREAFETVFLGAVRATRTVAAALKAEGGAIALVLSSSVRAPIPGLGLSNGFRPGLAGVAKDMADQYGPHGVRIVSLLPGRLSTDRNRVLLATAGDPEPRPRRRPVSRSAVSATRPSSARSRHSCCPRRPVT